VSKRLILHPVRNIIDNFADKSFHKITNTGTNHEDQQQENQINHENQQQQKIKLKIWGKAQRESTGRPKSDWGTI